MSAANFDTWFSTLSPTQQELFTAGMAEHPTMTNRQVWRMRSGERWIKQQHVKDFCAWEIDHPSATSPQVAASQSSVELLPDSPGNAGGSREDPLKHKTTPRKRARVSPPIDLDAKDAPVAVSLDLPANPAAVATNASAPTLATAIEELLHHLTSTLHRIDLDIPAHGQDVLSVEVSLLNELTSKIQTTIDEWAKQGRLEKRETPDGTRYILITEEVRLMRSLAAQLVDCRKFLKTSVPVVRGWLEEVGGEAV